MRVSLTLAETLPNLGRNRRVTKRAPKGCAADSGDFAAATRPGAGSTRPAPHGSDQHCCGAGSSSLVSAYAILLPSVDGAFRQPPRAAPTTEGGSMSDALVVVLIGVLLVALATLVIVVRRRPPAPAPFDEEALRRLVQLAVAAPGPDGHIAESRPEPETDLSHFALLSHEATAAAEAADVVRRTASEAADELRDRSRREAEQLRADALAEAERTVGAARAQAAELRAGLDSERSRIIVEATAVLAEDRRELQEAEQRVRAATDVLADEQQAL